MAKSARTYVFESQERIPDVLRPFVEARMKAALGDRWLDEIRSRVKGLNWDKKNQPSWDQLYLLKTMNIFWNEAFRDTLGPKDRAYVNELITVRNDLAHDKKFSYDEAARAVETMALFLDAVGAGELSTDIAKSRDTIISMRSQERRRNEERKKTLRLDLPEFSIKGLLPWREVMTPHEDVRKGKFEAAQFAANLWDVHQGRGSPEYTRAEDFFARTFLTEGLATLLRESATRLLKGGGDPVRELKTNFGGGKTHSLLALYHMCSGADINTLPGLDQLFRDSDLDFSKPVHRAVIVGTGRGVNDEVKTKDGVTYRTSWGEMAWQLGGKAGYEMVRDCDESGVAPGADRLRGLFEAYSPCLILIDEWVVYLRNLYGVAGQPAGSFESNISFVQALTEAVKVSPQALLVASLPESRDEAGGAGGETALDILQKVFGRIESPWKPASQTESYEIVRRRLFEDLAGDMVHHRDNAVKQFMTMYKDNSDAFPSETRNADYKRKLEASYPIHPELFDHLYKSWGTLDQFQRTRGMLRMMAQIIHHLSRHQDTSIMIMPGSVPMDHPEVSEELTRYLSQGWSAIIDGDVDGPGSTPDDIESEAPNLLKALAVRRIARTLFLATAPLSTVNTSHGIATTTINLGVLQPGEKPNLFSDALRRLSIRAKFLHGENDFYWYDNAPSLTRMAADYARDISDTEANRRIDDLLKTYINRQTDRGAFEGIYVAPDSHSDVPDEATGIRLVVQSVKFPHNNGSSTATTEASFIIKHFGQRTRAHCNNFVFLAADKRQADLLRDAVRMYLAWQRIVDEKGEDNLNLPPGTAKKAERQMQSAERTMSQHLAEAFCWLIYPVQQKPGEDFSMTSRKLPASDKVLGAVMKKLEDDGVVYHALGPTQFNDRLDKYIWHDHPHLRLAELWDHHTRFLYLPRFAAKSSLCKTIVSGISATEPGPFAYADGYDEGSDQYQGLVIEAGGMVNVAVTETSLIVRPDVAETYRVTVQPPPNGGGDEAVASPRPGSPENTPEDEEPAAPAEVRPRQFKGRIALSATRSINDMGKVAEAIVEQLTSVPGAKVELWLDIEAESPDGFDKDKQRTLLENANTLGFDEKFMR